MFKSQPNHRKHGGALPHERSRIPLIAELTHPDKSLVLRAKMDAASCSSCPTKFFRQIQGPKPTRNHGKA